MEELLFSSPGDLPNPGIKPGLLHFRLILYCLSYQGILWLQCVHQDIWMGELDYKVGWVLKNWCFHIVVLEKTLESPLDCKEIKPVNPKGLMLMLKLKLKLKLKPMGSLRVGHDSAISLSLFTFMHWSRKWQPTPVFLPGESRDGGAWWAAVYGVAQSRTRLKRLSSSSSSSRKPGVL